jgi:hypothetical protein
MNTQVLVSQEYFRMLTFFKNGIYFNSVYFQFINTFL